MTTAPTTAPHSSFAVPTVVHVTHEGVEHLGGIGTVLEGMITSPVYQKAVRRSILVGPLPWPDRRPSDPRERLGSHAVACRYSGPDHHDPEGLGAVLRPIEWAFGVRIVFGTRRFEAAGGLTAEAELLLIDVNNPDPDRLGAFKWMLFEKFGIDSRSYEHGWDYEEWCRLADPAYHALVALGVGSATGAAGHGTHSPAVVISHEFMGMCTALRCQLDRSRFRTAFHAHECSTARRIVEHLPGQDVAFYPVMRRAMKEGKFIEDVFGSQADFSRHALVSKTYLLDAIMAVGPETAEELQFLSPKMNQAPVSIAYNGLPAPPTSFEDKQRSRELVGRWLRNIGAGSPDYLITHVTRPVESKGLWRDLKVLTHLDRHLKSVGKTATYVLLTCGAPTRTFDQATAMSRDHAWPLRHREGFPDVDGPEVGIWRQIEQFTRNLSASSDGASTGGARAILVNQFGFTRERLGEAAPEGLSIHDLRAAADCEMGMSIYEPYGIAHLEALHAGAVCIPSTVCGCLGLVRRAMKELGLAPSECPLVLAAEFTNSGVTDAAHFTAKDRDALEEQVCRELAKELFARLPESDDDRRKYLQLGQRLAQRMSWDAVCETDILPILHGTLDKD